MINSTTTLGATAENPDLPPSIGAVTLFQREVCDSIKSVLTNDDNEAAIKSTIPIWSGIPKTSCVMALDVHPRAVSKFTEGLFQTSVKWVQEKLQITMLNGSTMISSGPELHLSGAKDEAILEFFGPEIAQAIRASPLRQMELSKGQNTTDCVSMVVSEEVCTTSLTLDMAEAVKLRNPL